MNRIKKDQQGKPATSDNNAEKHRKEKQRFTNGRDIKVLGMGVQASNQYSI